MKNLILGYVALFLGVYTTIAAANDYDTVYCWRIGGRYQWHDLSTNYVPINGTSGYASVSEMIDAINKYMKSPKKLGVATFYPSDDLKHEASELNSSEAREIVAHAKALGLEIEIVSR